MTDFWVAVGLLVVVVVGSLLWAMLRRPRQGAARLSYDLAVYKDQLAELELDLERGTLNETEADAARAEIERRILAIADQDGEVTGPAASGGPGRMIAIGFVGLAVPAFSIGVYLYLGTPQYPDIPYATRDIARETDTAGQPREKAPDIAEMARKLAQRLETEPNNLRGWMLLGRTYLSLERNADALAALRKAKTLAPDDPAVTTELAEALVVTSNNQVSEEARALFQAALSADARGPRPRYYLALADAQAGKLAEALQGWVDLLAVSPPDAPWRPTVEASIKRAAADLKIDPAGVEPSLAAKLLGPGKPQAAPPPETATAPPMAAPSAPGPSREDMEAASQMSAGDRQAMIQSMVQRLAERLRDEPDDLAGWQRLARAYRVLGETKKAEDAEAQIKRLSQ